MNLNDKNFDKIVPVKQWLTEHLTQDGKFKFWKLVSFIAMLHGYKDALVLLLKFLFISLKWLYEKLPLLIEFIEWLINLASSLSYKKEEFFYAIF